MQRPSEKKMEIVVSVFYLLTSLEIRHTIQIIIDQDAHLAHKSTEEMEINKHPKDHICYVALTLKYSAIEK